MLKPPECDTCVLGKIGESFSQPEGKGTIGVHIVGEALGLDEATDGLPFRPRAQAGSLLEKAIRTLGFSRAQFKLWNLIACRPPGNVLAGAGYEQKAIEHCRVHFDRVINRDGSNVIFATGNLPLQYLTGASGNAKEKQSISHLRGFVLRGPYGLVIPSFHPAFIRRGKAKYTEVFEMDLLRAVKVARGQFNHPHKVDWWTPPKFQDSPSLDDVRAFYNQAKDNLNLPMGVDIETPHSKDKDEGGKRGDEEEEGDDEDTIETDYTEGDDSKDSTPIEEEGDRASTDTYNLNASGGSDRRSGSNSQTTVFISPSDGRLREPILTVQFSLGEWEGISIPYIQGYVEWIDKILALVNLKLFWNGLHFDMPRLLIKGHSLGGVGVDLMWTWHHYQPDLDRNLQFAASYWEWPFPWKHYYGTKLGWYGCADVAVLIWIKNRLLPKMKAVTHPVSGVSTYDGWKRFVHDIIPFTSGMSRRGMPINLEEREKVGKYLMETKERLFKSVQGEVPLGVRNLRPKRIIK